MTAQGPDLDSYSYLALGLVSAPVADVEDAIRAVFAKFEPHRFTVLHEPLRLDAVYTHAPPPGGAHAKRVALWEPSNATATTAFVPNMEDAWMTLFTAVCERIPGQHILVTTSSDADEWPATTFEVWKDGVSVRRVSAALDDDGWHFTNHGTPLPFEDPDRYKRRRIATRLDREAIVLYLQRLGWDLTSRQFWQTTRDAVLLRENKRDA